MADTQLNIITDTELVSQAEFKLKNIGLDLNVVINKFLQKIVEDDSEQTKESLKDNPKLEKMTNEDAKKRIILAQQKGSREEAMGILKGMIWIADDFDEPMDCMKEYM